MTQDNPGEGMTGERALEILEALSPLLVEVWDAGEEAEMSDLYSFTVRINRQLWHRIRNYL